jgi:hypothetical protein
MLNLRTLNCRNEDFMLKEKPYPALLQGNKVVKFYFFAPLEQ